jgi:hypothetical protein
VIRAAWASERNETFGGSRICVLWRQVRHFGSSIVPNVRIEFAGRTPLDAVIIF